MGTELMRPEIALNYSIEITHRRDVDVDVDVDFEAKMGPKERRGEGDEAHL